MKKIIFQSILISIFLLGCGGGGGSASSQTNELLSDAAKALITTQAVDYSNYAWNITPKDNLNSFLDLTTIDANANINMPSSSTSNNQKIKVAIIDQGFDTTHPDLKDKIIDINYLNQTNLEDEYHGTGVAGVIASTYLGVAPNNVELILINIEFGINTELDLLNAFDYAQQQGAKIINCSWGVDLDENPTYTPSAIFIYAMQLLKDDGINVVFSSGNSAKDLDSFDSRSEVDGVIGVGATSSMNKLTSYSNYGSNIDIYAPGGDSTHGILSLDLVGTAGDNGGFANPNYKYWTGTSFSAPTISGVIALMLAQNPNLTPDEIITTLTSTADTITDESETNSYLKVNVQAAIDAL